MSFPRSEEYAPFYAGYVAACEGLTLTEALNQAFEAVHAYCLAIPVDAWNHRYAPEKWTRGQVMTHLLDGQAVFFYRAVRIVRGDTTPLPGFDENAFAADTQDLPYPHPTWPAQWLAWKELALALFRDLSDERLQRTGVASGHLVSTRALGYIMAGHVLHHLHILNTRYS